MHGICLPAFSSAAVFFRSCLRCRVTFFGLATKMAKRSTWGAGGVNLGLQGIPFMLGFLQYLIAASVLPTWHYEFSLQCLAQDHGCG